MHHGKCRSDQSHAICHAYAGTNRTRHLINQQGKQEQKMDLTQIKNQNAKRNQPRLQMPKQEKCP